MRGRSKSSRATADALTTRDVVSRKDMLMAHLQLTSHAAARVLREEIGRFGFPGDPDRRRHGV